MGFGAVSALTEVKPGNSVAMGGVVWCIGPGCDLPLVNGCLELPLHESVYRSV